jgi:YHS domain-containing protein
MFKATMIALGFAIAAVSPVLAKQPPVSTDVRSNVATGGYDVVAYFMDGEPVKGSEDFVTRYNGATWYFASAAHRDAFIANPAAYVPQYGGYCAFAVSKGYTAPSDPNAWKIVDGKLYLNYNSDVQAMWSKDIPGHIAAATKNWPKLLSK